MRLPALIDATTLHAAYKRAAAAASSGGPSSVLSSAAALGAAARPRLRVLDASWFMPHTKRDARAEFSSGTAPRLPGAVFFDVDAVVDASRSPGLPHMLPRPHELVRGLQALGINAIEAPAGGTRPPAPVHDSDAAAAAERELAEPFDAGQPPHLVVYDRNPLMRTACRAWWTLRTLGVHRVSVLDGGLEAWVAAGLPVEEGVPQHPTSEEGSSAEDSKLPPIVVFPPAPDRIVASMADMQQILAAGKHWVLDARPAGRFAGKEPEPRPGIPSGHMAGARSVPVGTLLDSAGKFKPVGDLRALVAAACQASASPDTVDQLLAGKNFVTTCGSGMTAATLAFALHRIGVDPVALYDGSWTEWASSGGEIIKDA